MGRKKRGAAMKNWWIRLLASALILVTGALLTMGYRQPTSQWGGVAQALGLALLVTGAASLFREGVLGPLRLQDIEEFVDKHEHASQERLAGLQREVQKVQKQLPGVQQTVQEQFGKLSGLLRGAGMRMVSAQRRGYPGYHKWVLEDAPQDMFFAGRSVLHRVRADFESLQLLSVEEALARKVAEGSHIRILFLDPSWDFVKDIARWEGQDSTLRADLATTLGVCRRLWERIEDHKFPGSLEIRACQELQQYAFHHVVCKQKMQAEMLVGFYFAGVHGIETPLFVVDNEAIKEVFERHFNTVFNRAKELLFYSQHGIEKRFQSDYFRQCANTLAEHIGHDKVNDLCWARASIAEQEDQPDQQ